MPENGEFRDMSAEVAKRFLQTVVVVDDEAKYFPTDRPTQIQELGDSVPLDEYEDDTEEEDVGDGDELIEPADDGRHILDAKALTDAFAEQELICAILRPEKKRELQSDENEETDESPEPLLDRTLRAIRRSDLVVLDWKIDKDYGQEIRRIISAITSEDEKERRLRLIAIYTAEQDLPNIAATIVESVEPAFEQQEEFVLCREHIKIVIYAKERALVIPQHEHRKVPYQELPSRLIGDFAAMAHGLVTNVAVESLSVLRESTYSLLTRLHADLDAPYLTHRLLLPRPDDAPEFLVSLVMSELRSVLDGHSVGEKAGASAIRAWLAQKHSECGELTLTRKNSEVSVARSDLEEWLIDGKLPNRGKNWLEELREENFRTLTAYFCNESDKAESLDSEFAMLTTVRERHNHVGFGPMLSLGTIVEDVDVIEGAARYWLCIQPRCDSVRLKEETQFPFLPYEENASKFKMVIRDRQGNFVRLKPRYRPSACKMLTFMRTDEAERAVRASNEANSEWFFRTADTGRSYRWVAELKYEQAQREIAEYASIISRVGLDESEWLRRSVGR